MKRFFAIAMILVMTLFITACSRIGSAKNALGEIIYTGEFTITKLEPYHDIPTGWSHLMCAKSGDVGVLLKVLPDAYLKYEIGYTIHGEVKSSADKYYFKFDDSEWLNLITAIGFNNQERKRDNNMYDNNKMAMEVGRIEYLSCKGKVVACTEYLEKDLMVAEIKECLDCGCPINIVLYRDKNGKTMPKDWVENLDCMPAGFQEIDYPYA